MPSPQHRRFHELRHRFEALYRAAAAYDATRFIDSQWSERNAELMADLLPEPPFSFIRHPVILYTMFVPARYMGIELDFLRSRLPEGILRLALTEDPTGDPVLVPGPGGAYRTSANLVHHLHHLERLAAATGVRPERFDTVVEWGGGYGSQARLFRKLHGGAPTYVIVDTPLFSVLQWLYLSSVFGPQTTRLLTRENDRVEPGRYNLVPLGLVHRLRLRGELFVSMWALNESSRAAQDHVVERRWFGADRLLMGMHDGEPLIGRAIADGAHSEPVGEFLPGQRYLFR